MSVCEAARLAGGHQAFTSTSGLTSSFRTCCRSIEKDAVEVKRFFLGAKRKSRGRASAPLGAGRERSGCVHLLCLFSRNDKDVCRMKREPEAVLGVCGLHIRRGRTTILPSVSWSVERGQHWVILGANRSGKTTLLTALTAYLA